MSTPLFWIPRLTVDSGHSATSAVTRFLRWHHGRGHVVILGDDVHFETGSQAFSQPRAGQVWHTNWPITGDHDGPVDLVVPADQLLALRAKPKFIRHLRRLIVTRPPALPLPELERLLMAVPQESLYLDWSSIGHEAIAYLLTKYATAQVEGVPDDALHLMLAIADHIHRPAMLSDFSGRAPVLLGKVAMPAIPTVSGLSPRNLPARHQWL